MIPRLSTVIPRLGTVILRLGTMTPHLGAVIPRLRSEWTGRLRLFPTRSAASYCSRCASTRHSPLAQVKAWQIPHRGSLEGLKIVDLPDPAPGPGEVLVRIRAAAVNYRDLIATQIERPGWLTPLIPCSDGAGEIAAVGQGVTRWKPGDRVISCIFQGMGGVSHPRPYPSIRWFFERIRLPLARAPSFTCWRALASAVP